MGKLRCFLSEYQNLVNEQIFVFREITVFSPENSSRCCFRDSRFIRLGRITHRKDHLLFVQAACTPMHRIREIQKRGTSDSKFLPSNSVWSSSSIKHLLFFFSLAWKFRRLQILDLCLAS